MRSRFRGLPGLLAFLLSFPAFAAPKPAVEQRPNLLLIVIDTLRYSATSFGNPARNNTPFLASLAARGTVFTNAYSTHDFTPPSHFSIFTGLRDGLASDDDRVENSVAWQLHRIGYDTFATVANSLIGQEQMPTLRGFKRFHRAGDVTTGQIEAIDSMTEIDFRLALFHCRSTPHARAMLYYSADRLLPIFLQQIRVAHPPYFGFVNLVDPHEPYVPDPKGYRPERLLPPGFEGDVINRRLGPEQRDPDSIKDPQRRAYMKQKIADVGGSKSLLSIDLSPQALEIYRQRYRAKVRGVDEVLNQFFAELNREQLLENTVVIITSDHGESFGEADLITHMFQDKGDFESTHHVPLLIVVPPKMHPAPAVIDRRVSIADLAPTIYDLAGLNWSGFASEHKEFAHSLFSLFDRDALRYRASVIVPKRAKQDQTEAERERAKALKSLGYVH